MRSFYRVLIERCENHDVLTKRVKYRVIESDQFVSAELYRQKLMYHGQVFEAKRITLLSVYAYHAGVYVSPTTTLKRTLNAFKNGDNNAK